VIDPGFGFGKSTAHNFRLLNGLEFFTTLGRPVLAGMSRKGMVHRTLGIEAGEAANGTSVLHTIALLNGAMMLRTHDVRQTMEAIRLVEVYKKGAVN
jgi:dihydropteroate synthase